MAKIHFVLTRFEQESIAEFKVRCSQAMDEVHASPDDFGIGRFTATDAGLDGTTEWGQFWTDVLPSEMCVIASYDKVSARYARHPYSQAELNAAPRNPDFAQIHKGTANGKNLSESPRIQKMPRMKTFELTAAGFNASSGLTGDLVFRVSAPSEAVVKEAIEDTGADFCGEVEGCGLIADFTLPAQAMQLASALLEKASDHRNANRWTHRSSP